MSRCGNLDCGADADAGTSVDVAFGDSRPRMTLRIPLCDPCLLRIIDDVDEAGQVVAFGRRPGGDPPPG